MAVADLSPIYQRDFEANLRSLSQQRGSKLRPFVIERNAPDMHLWDRIGAPAPFLVGAAAAAVAAIALIWYGVRFREHRP